MNLGDRKIDNITLYSDGNSPSMKVGTPDKLKDNLTLKKIGFKKITINSYNLPQFIPDIPKRNLMTYTPGSANDLVINDPNSTANIAVALGYFVVVRTKDNNQACASWLKYNNPNNIVPSFANYNITNVPNPTNADVYDVLEPQKYELPYYYMYNFTDFLKYVAQAIDDGIKAVTPTSGFPSTICIYDNVSKCFNLSINNTVDITYYIEFSESLYKLLRFNAKTINNLGTTTINNVQYFQNTYRIEFLAINRVINGFTYVNSVSRIKNLIGPFDTFILECPSLPLQYTTFRSSKDAFQSYSATFKAVKIWKKKLNILDMDENIYDEELDLADDLFSFTSDQPSGQYLEFRLIVKTQNGKFIEWVFPKEEVLEGLLYTYDIY